MSHLTSAALLAAMSAATVASPASAAKPRCQGQTATIVGTKKADIDTTAVPPRTAPRTPGTTPPS